VCLEALTSLLFSLRMKEGRMDVVVVFLAAMLGLGMFLYLGTLEDEEGNWWL